MTLPRDSLDGIRAFLAYQLNASVSTRADLDREVIVFEARQPEGATICAFEITDEALRDHPAEAIIEDLRRHEVVQRLQRDPTMRLRYSTDRDVPSFESLEVRWDGRRYRVVRDAQHNVRIFDASDRALERTPTMMLVMPSSIFRRSLGEWCGDIAAWRGTGQ